MAGTGRQIYGNFNVQVLRLYCNLNHYIGSRSSQKGQESWEDRELPVNQLDTKFDYSGSIDGECICVLLYPSLLQW